MAEMVTTNTSQDTLSSNGVERRAGWDKEIVQEAQDNWQRASDYTSDSCTRWLDDYKFANADAYNRWQWPINILKDRDSDDRPCLTMNKVRQHNLQIRNDAKQNKPGIKFRATGGGASYESAQMYDAIARHIEYQSHAQDCYDLATGYMVDGGFGWLRLKTEFVDQDSFDQEIYIVGVRDALSIYLDPDAQEVDKSDAEWGFAFETMTKKEYKKKYPKFAEFASEEPLDGVVGWLGDDEIRVAEYFRRKHTADTIYAIEIPLADGSGSETSTLRRSEIEKSDPEMVRTLESDPKVRSRSAPKVEVERFVIAGNHVVEGPEVWPGKYIPLVPVYAEETLVEGVMDRKSHTRAFIDAQRMYNYWASAAVEFGALQSKTPYLIAIESVEGYETYWKNANKINYAYLPYNALDDAGAKLPPPTRQDPPVAAPVALEGMKIAQMEMMMVSGQYESSMGQGSNERSGKAINERQRQGDNATYHFINGLGVAIRNIGRQIEDLIPKVYDTKRVLQILAADGTPLELQIDPKAAKAFEIQRAEANATAVRIFNPNVGRYEVEADIGPGYGTKRQETWNALTLLLTQAPQLTAIVGDLLLKSADFPLADEAAARLRRMVPSYALGEGPSQSEQLLQQQVAHLSDLLAKIMEELSLEKLKVKGKEQQRDIGVQDSFTKRLKVLLDAQIKAAKPGGTVDHPVPGSGSIDVSTLQALLDQAAEGAEEVDLQPILESNLGVLEAGVSQLKLPGILDNSKPPVPGAKLGLNGKWYLKDAAAQKGLTPIA